MCELTNGKIYTADRDIVCYKIVMADEPFSDVWHSPVYAGSMRYCEGNVYGFAVGLDFINRCMHWGTGITSLWKLGIFSDSCWKHEVCLYENASSEWQKFFKGYTKAIQFDHKAAEGLKLSKEGLYTYSNYMNGRMERDLEFYKKESGEKHKYFPARCRIPKGSKYIVSDSGEVFVSERLCFDKVIFPKSKSVIKPVDAVSDVVPSF